MIPLNTDTRWILSQTPDSCHGIATRLRKLGQTVEDTPEAEQAVSIHWMLQMWELYGADWREKGRAELLKVPVVELIEPPEPDDRYQEAIDLIKETGVVTVASLQRRLRIGYNRASRILELMAANGIVSLPDAGVPGRYLK